MFLPGEAGECIEASFKLELSWLPPRVPSSGPDHHLAPSEARYQKQRKRGRRILFVVTYCATATTYPGRYTAELRRICRNRGSKVRKTPSWPRSWANFSLS
jgi:hypothetical protein